MKIILTAICVGLAMYAWPVSARIGDTFFQCKSRYGQPVSPGFQYYPLRRGKDGWALFDFKTIYVYVKCYEDKKVGRIVYDTSKAAMPFDREDFLALNSRGSAWVPVAGKSYSFETKDGQLRAKREGHSAIEIWTVASEKLEEAEKAARTAHLKKTALKGFGDDAAVATAINPQAATASSSGATVPKASPATTPPPAKAARDDTDSTQSEAALGILSATYGAENVQEDVTSIVTGKVFQGRLRFRVGNNELGGDPISGKVKELRVKFAVSGQEMERTFREGEQAALP
jgi:hypothetical protein